MRYPLDPLDCNSNIIAAGDIVVFVRATDNLLIGLPKEDQERIRTFEGKKVKILDIDEYGFAELEFELEEDTNGVRFVTIWVEPRYLMRP